MSVRGFCRLFGIVLPGIVLLLSSCASNPELIVDETGWTYEDRALSVQVTSPSDLNAISGRPHSVAIGVFQLNDPNTFSGLAVTKQGAIELMDKGKIDDTVASFQRIIVQPGETKTALFARARNAKYIGLVIGYYELNPRNDIHIYEVPVVPSDRGVVDVILSRLGLIADEAKAVPGKLYLSIDLGRKGTKRVVQMEEEKLRIL